MTTTDTPPVQAGRPKVVDRAQLGLAAFQAD